MAALRCGDESAFADVVDRYTPTMLRVARNYVASHEAAEDVVQETWIALLKGIDKFEGRSSLRTWLFAVLVNVAKARGIRDHQNASREVATTFPHGASVDPAHFRPADDQYPGGWRPEYVPAPWQVTPETSVLSDEIMTLARTELETLPPRQRMVVALRDMLGLDAGEVCTLLSLTTENQRVLLHRGRTRIRQGLEAYLAVDSV